MQQSCRRNISILKAQLAINHKLYYTNLIVNHLYVNVYYIYITKMCLTALNNAVSYIHTSICSVTISYRLSDLGKVIDLRTKNKNKYKNKTELDLASCIKRTIWKENKNKARIYCIIICYKRNYYNKANAV